jgi:hypothetical protein
MSDDIVTHWANIYKWLDHLNLICVTGQVQQRALYDYVYFYSMREHVHPSSIEMQSKSGDGSTPTSLIRKWCIRRDMNMHESESSFSGNSMTDSQYDNPADLQTAVNKLCRRILPQKAPTDYTTNA